VYPKGREVVALEYTVQKLAQMAGVSTRTLRYYDEIDLLKPIRINSSGYRIYGSKEVDRLQQILFYRALGVKLESIKEILDSPDFQALAALEEHRRQLLKRKQQIDELLKNVEKTIKAARGEIVMTNEEKFAGFKEQMLQENERKYGKEIREKYGKEAVENSYDKLRKMTTEEYKELKELEEKLITTLKAAYAQGDPAGELAQKAAVLHRRWLSFYWPQYTREAHAGIVEMYVNDQRFTDYYDRHQPGLARFLRDAVLVYTGK